FCAKNPVNSLPLCKLSTGKSIEPNKFSKQRQQSSFFATFAGAVMRYRSFLSTQARNKRQLRSLPHF
ncbi:hypothetical protein, partial [Loigolactobacillus binensis]